ncbi:RING finger domain-containing protein [Cardinium endosymbiont of Culicoides punctatus]|uniref:RING finger domain-containing protein n=1 Tax=Cardinium endosymbiont of Culicoides punctatus TaxID=2304601 RepID=UPI001058513C|nr:RING finger domain-containing protein [Cardinium endosymbiont of Culicoides punctatus]TDG95335.1 hypothetical protein CCPUN_04740 [Cardinium endosymbiont of Culicoides punctatus]
MILYNFYVLLKKVRGSSLCAFVILLYVINSSCTRSLTYIHNVSSQLSEPVGSTLSISYSGQDAELKRALDLLKYKLEEVDHFGNTSLHKAAKKGDYETVKILLDNGADKFKVNKHGYTPLMMAVISRHHHLKELLSSECSICFQDLCLSNSENIVILPCHSTHQFHKDCMVESIRMGNEECPLCRKHVDDSFMEDSLYLKECPICLAYMNLSNPNDIVILPCHSMHQFHKNCMVESIRMENEECPLCRKLIDQKFIKTNKLQRSLAFGEYVMAFSRYGVYYR